MRRFFLWVQHLLGTGHVERMRWIAEALAERGAEVTFVSGGLPLPGRLPRLARVVQLPPLRAADASFRVLVDERGVPIDDAFRARRVSALLDAWRGSQADVVLLETFPFGRRALRFELMPLLDAIAASSPRPRVVSSVRDLLQVRGDAARDAEAWDVARRCLDAILVHGDPAFARLEATFPPAADGTVPVVYTGFVRAPLAPPAPRERREVVVSASAGEGGTALLATAIEARAHSALRASPWRVLVGGGVTEQRFASLVHAGQAAGVAVERHRRDFPDLLAGARVAVTQAGYNTVLDVLLARTPAVLVPFAGEGETEQAMRAAKLAALGRVETVDEHSLDPRVLSAAIDRAAARGEMPPCPFDVDGATRSAAWLLSS